MFEAEEKVYRVAPLAVPDADGGWPCGFCGDLFPVQRSWRVTLARSGTVIACETCAREARRHRAGGGRRGSTAAGGSREEATRDAAAHPHRRTSGGRVHDRAGRD